MAPRLILFDVDGTLLTCHRRVRRVIRQALADCFGGPIGMDGYDFSGKTDDRIVTELLTRAGASPERIAAGLPAMRDVYPELLERELAAEEMRLLPGVSATLEALSRRNAVTLGLLTGNWERGARIKLSRFDLNRFFAFGAFGDGCLDRRELPPLAIRRAQEVMGRRFAPSEVLIVGDSPLDVACAQAHGIPCLAVATGWTSAEDLAAAGADWVCQNLHAAETLLLPPG